VGKIKQLPQWYVIIHNDDVNTFDRVAAIIDGQLHVGKEQAYEAAQRVHNDGKTTVFTTHKEHAEHLCCMFSKNALNCTIEPRNN
jgi:ATP-dependent Clp protease adapter protein ClpS